LNDTDPLLRREAAENFMAADSAGLIHMLAPLLGDPIKTVRMEAAYRLSTYRKDAFNETQYRLFRKAFEEYKSSLEYLADFPSGRFNLGNYYAKTKDLLKAEENYREAIALDNLFYPAKINLAMLYYQEGKMELAEQLFNDLITNHPDVQDGFYYLALLYGEQKRFGEAIAILETASTKSGANPRIWYNLGLLYQATGQNDKCVATLLRGLSFEPCNYDMLYALFAFYMNQHDRVNAAPCIKRLRSCFPREKTVQDLCNEFENRR
jgi:tetratricopeptide (TPR) repeat protein